MTRPTVLSGSVTLEEILNIAHIFMAAYKVAEETREVTLNLVNLMQQVRVVGIQVYDTNIVATMQAYNIGRLLTHNVADFLKYSPSITVLPLFEGQI